MKTFDSVLRGVIPDTIIHEFIESGCIKNARPECVQPGSIDITLDLNTVFEVDYFSPPRKGERIESILKELCSHKAARELKQSPVFSKDKKYLVRINEQLYGIPFYARMNPKSSPGRVFLHSRLLTDGCMAYDEVYPYHQPSVHWVMISPKTFSVIPSENEPISQLRFFKGSDRLSRKDLEREVGHECFIRFPAEQPSLFDDEELVPVVGDDIASHLLTVDLRCDIVAYKTKNIVEPISLGSRSINPKEYFDYIYSDEVRAKGLILEKGVGYLLGSYERIMLPAHLAGEVVPYSEKYGELRNHFAGYIDSGFGLNTSNGNSITFEVITNENGVCIRHRQSIGELRYEYMSSKPNVLYQGNYKLQLSGPQLPKYFTK